MKKIALPTRNGLIDDHFGHCEFYTIFTVDEENRIVRHKCFLLHNAVDVSRTLLPNCRQTG